jgi:hypothetical protein
MSNWENRYLVLARCWFEYIFDLEPHQYEDFKISFNIYGRGDVEFEGWFKPPSRTCGWQELNAGMYENYFDDFPDEFYVSYVSFEPADIFLILAISTMNDLTTYTCCYAPDHIRKEWDTYKKDNRECLLDTSNAMGVKMDKLASLKEDERLGLAGL